MKVIYHQSGGFDFEPEDGRDLLFIGELLKGIQKEDRKTLNKYFHIDMGSGCISEKGDRDDCSIEDALDIDKDDNGHEYLWCDVERLSFDPTNAW